MYTWDPVWVISGRFWPGFVLVSEFRLGLTARVRLFYDWIIFTGLAHWSFPAFIGGRLDGNGMQFICDLSV